MKKLVHIVIKQLLLQEKRPPAGKLKIALTNKNPYAEDYPQRSKGKNHGYGLQNVQRCVNKYEGHMATEQKDGVFTLWLRLNGYIPAPLRKP